MSAEISIQEYLASYTDVLLESTARAVDELTAKELQYRPEGPCNSIGFDAWHIGRTADNLIHFAFDRDKPVWLQQELNEKWNLPKVDQGTSMTPEEAYALVFPEGDLLAKYIRDVRNAIVPKIRDMSMDYLLEEMYIRPNGDLAKYEIIGQVIINHGNQHYGQINMAVTMLGKPGLGV